MYINGFMSSLDLQEEAPRSNYKPVLGWLDD